MNKDVKIRLLKNGLRSDYVDLYHMLLKNRLGAGEYGEECEYLHEEHLDRLAKFYTAEYGVSAEEAEELLNQEQVYYNTFNRSTQVDNGEE